jgi:hypothetical protein
VPSNSKYIPQTPSRTEIENLINYLKVWSRTDRERTVVQNRIIRLTEKYSPNRAIRSTIFCLFAGKQEAQGLIPGQDCIFIVFSPYWLLCASPLIMHLRFTLDIPKFLKRNLRCPGFNRVVVRNLALNSSATRRLFRVRFCRQLKWLHLSLCVQFRGERRAVRKF